MDRREIYLGALGVALVALALIFFMSVASYSPSTRRTATPRPTTCRRTCAAS